MSPPRFHTADGGIRPVVEKRFAAVLRSKMAGGSERQRRDVAGIVAGRGADLDRSYIERWVSDLDLSEEWTSAQAVAP